MLAGWLLTQKAGINMKPISELRKGERFSFKSPVLIQDYRTEFRYDGTMLNFSNSGMYLETDYAPRPNRKIKIKVNNLPNSPFPKNFLAEVKWRQPLSKKASTYSYGIGVECY